MVWKAKSWALAGLALASFSLAGCAAMAEEPAQAAPPQATASQSGGFAGFLDGVRADALASGIRASTLDVALAGIRHNDRVIELDRKQPEFTLSLDEYMDRIVNDKRVADGRRHLAENKTLLSAIEQRFGVQPRFVVALWGIETGFGRNTGGMSVVGSLATLAYDGRRAKYFRTELMNALTILDQGHIAPGSMIGSWAGAMGQCQFMPSTFLKWAVDWDEDGKRDIWTNRADALASAANYLSGEGWKGDQTWGREVNLPKEFDKALLGLETQKPVTEWAALGVTAVGGKPLPAKAMTLSASIVRPEPDGQAFLVYDNFRVIMKWNRSTFFALAAGHLADRIGGK